MQVGFMTTSTRERVSNKIIVMLEIYIIEDIFIVLRKDKLLLVYPFTLTGGALGFFPTTFATYVLLQRVDSLSLESLAYKNMLYQPLVVLHESTVSYVP